MEEESGRASLKLQEKEDRISKLSDHLIQRILYFLPSDQAIKTGVLSKRWRNQWARVPVLDFRYTNLTPIHYISFVDTTIILHDCSKIVKFYLDYCPSDPNWYNARIHFAIRKGVEELILKGCDGYMLPGFLYEYASLVRLETIRCNFKGKANWESLKNLKITRACFFNQSMEGVLSGCPVLESLELICYCCSVRLVGLLVIASKSLKMFYLDRITNVSVIEISCPNLEELNLFRCNGSQAFKFVDLPSSVRDSVYHWDECTENLAKDILQQLRHVKELRFGRSFVKIPSALKVEGLSYLLLNNRCSYLTLDYIHFVDDFRGIAYALCNSPLVEKLVIKLFPRKLKHQDQVTDDDLCDLGECYWNSNRFVFNSLMSQLKTVKIIGLWERADDCKFVLHFIHFLLKNVRVLQKMVIIVREDLWTGTDFVSKVSQKLLSLPRCSPHAKVELCSTKLESSIF